MWPDLWPWLVGFVVLALAAMALWLALRRPLTLRADDLQDRAFELWLAGDLPGARDALREVVRREPQRSLPYLQLGILLRLLGDAPRATALHRSLAVREDLTAGRRLSVGLELAEDLLALAKPEEALDVLQRLEPLAADHERWYRLRFRAALGGDDHDGALSALREGEKRLPADGEVRLRALRAAWLTDRVLLCARAGEFAAARRYLNPARKLPEAAARIPLLRALVAAGEGDEDRAVQAVADGLASYPAEMAPVLPLLEGALLAANRFALVVPILEAACRDDAAPPAIWMALARIYEKLDRRDDALRLLASKRGDRRLTPDAAAPYLRLLTAEQPQAAFSRVWSMLSAPRAGDGYVCRRCDRRDAELRWFCPRCLSTAPYEPFFDADAGQVAPSGAPHAAPPRY